MPSPRAGINAGGHVLGFVCWLGWDGEEVGEGGAIDKASYTKCMPGWQYECKSMRLWTLVFTLSIPVGRTAAFFGRDTRRGLAE